MTKGFQLNGPITKDRAEAATEWMVHNAVKIGRAKAEMQRAENMLRVVKSLAMAASDEKSAAMKETEAYGSERYQGAIDALFRATEDYETLMSTRVAAQCVIDVWRSLNSTLRGSGV